MIATTSDTVDGYISGFPKDTQDILQQIRATIKSAAPDSTELIKYGIPTFVLHGNLVHFGGYKNHIGFYPAPSGMTPFEYELEPYKTGKGTLQFPLNKPLPLDLILRIVKFRVEQNMEKAQKKRKI